MKNFSFIFSFLLYLLCLTTQLGYSSIKAVIFDYGGVCIYFQERDLVDFVSKELGVSVDNVKAHIGESAKLVSCGKIDESTMWQNFADECHITLPPNWNEKLHCFFMENIQKNPPVYDLIAKLQDKGIQTPLLSNVLPSQADMIRSINGYEAFTQVFLSCDLGYSKPDSEIYLAALEKLHLEPQECLFIDDSPTNVTAAKEVGMDAICYKCTKDRFDKLIKELNQRSIFVD